MSDDTIKNINKTIVHKDGKIDSFDKQLINLCEYPSNDPMH